MTFTTNTVLNVSHITIWKNLALGTIASLRGVVVVLGGPDSGYVGVHTTWTIWVVMGGGQSSRYRYTPNGNGRQQYLWTSSQLTHKNGYSRCEIFHQLLGRRNSTLGRQVTGSGSY